MRTALTNVERLLFISGSELGQRVTQHGNVIAAAEAAGVLPFVAYTSMLHAGNRRCCSRRNTGRSSRRWRHRA